MSMLKRVVDFLDAQGVPYLHTVHQPAYTARDVAAVEQLPLREVAKVVVFRSRFGYGIAVLPANRLLDLKELCSVLALPHVRLAKEEELARLFPDCELGAMPPFGNLVGMEVYVDQDLAKESLIAFNAGTHHDVIELHFSDFRKLVRPRIIHLTKSEVSCG